MKTKKVELPDELIAEAKAHLETLPKTPEEVIENWARLGKQVAGDMTEREAMNFLLGNVDICMQAKK